MAMPLIYSTISGKEIEVLLSFYIPYMNSFPAFQHNGQWMIIVGIVAVFQFNQCGGGKCGGDFHIFFNVVNLMNVVNWANAVNVVN
jgi:hypothetical protein